MDIRVYLNNGDILDFCQSDSALEQAVVAELQAGKIFSGRTLILGCGTACTLLQPSAISRIDVITSASLFLPHTLSDKAVVVDDEEVFRLRSKAAAMAFREGVAPGEKFTGYLRLELLGGHRLMLELERMLQNQTQFFTNLNRLLDVPVLAFPHPSGGAVFINMANVSSLSAAPGFAEYPKGSWPVELC